MNQSIQFDGNFVVLGSQVVLRFQVSGLNITCHLTGIPEHIINDIDAYWDAHQFDVEESVADYYEDNPSVWDMADIQISWLELSLP